MLQLFIVVDKVLHCQLYFYNHHKLSCIHIYKYTSILLDYLYLFMVVCKFKHVTTTLCEHQTYHCVCQAIKSTMFPEVALGGGPKPFSSASSASGTGTGSAAGVKSDIPDMESMTLEEFQSFLPLGFRGGEDLLWKRWRVCAPEFGWPAPKCRAWLLHTRRGAGLELAGQAWDMYTARGGTDKRPAILNA